MKMSLLLTCVFLCSMCTCFAGRRFHNSREQSSSRHNNERVSSADSGNVDSERYLEKFGYLEEIDGEGQHSDEARSEAIRQFQEFNGLAVSGILDSTTITKMQQPRCGLPDIMPLRFSAQGYKWDSNEVTWRITGRTGQLPYSSQRRAFYNAFRKWSDVTPLRFREEASGNSDILIKFASYEHGDGAGNSFDGLGQTLAHAFFPGSADLSGDTHFDESEHWTERSEDGTNLEVVAAHEFGHALGLSHSRDNSALMAPFYKGYDPNYALSRDDIQGIQSLYGGPSQPVTRRPNPTPRPTRRPRRTERPVTRRPRVTRRPTRRPPVTRRPDPTTPRPGGDNCDLRFDAIIVAHDHNTYAFRGRKIYRLNSNGYGIAQRTNINRVFRDAPINIGAAVYSVRQRKLYIFKSSRMWRYTGFTLDEGYPTTLHGFYRGIQSAIEWSDGDIYVFKGNGYSIWREDYSDAPRGYPLSITTYWSGVPNNVEAATRWRDGYTYFFKGSNYFKFSDYSRSVTRGYPKDKAASWMGCGRPVPK